MKEDAAGTAGPVMRFAASRGFEIGYEDAGSGPALVLVNGLAGTASEWRELGFVERLAGSHRVLSVDPIGHGRSSNPHEPDAYRDPAPAGDIIAVLDAVGVERAVFWGYSMGAGLACMAAIEFPGRVSALILGGQGFTEPMSPEVPAWAEPLSHGDWEGSWALLPFELTDYDKEQMLANDPRAIWAFLAGAHDSGYAHDLSRVRAPTLLYVGGGDDPADVQPSAEALGVELLIVGDGDHFRTFTDVDAIVPVVLRHLEAVGA